MAGITRQLNEALGETIQYLVDEFVEEHNIESDDSDEIMDLFYKSDEGKEVLAWIKQLPKAFDVE